MIAFRRVTASDASDRTFCVASWSASQRTSYSAGMIAMEDWPAIMHAQIAKVMDRPDMVTIVAFEKRDPAFIYGFITADPTEQRIPDGETVRWYPALVAYVFVKQNFRRTGIARQLFEAVGVDPAGQFLYSANTQQASRLASKVPRARFSPLVVRFQKERAA